MYKADCRRIRRQSAFLYRNLIAYFALFARVRMHLAHNVFFTIFPFSITVTRWRFGWNARFVARCEKLRAWPKVVALPHASHFAILSIPFVPLVSIVSAAKIFLFEFAGFPTNKKLFYHIFLILRDFRPFWWKKVSIIFPEQNGQPILISDAIIP